MENFISKNRLIKRIGFDEWYSPDGKSRLVKVGDRYRMDTMLKNWSTFRTDYIVGHRDREFRIKENNRRW